MTTDTTDTTDTEGHGIDDEDAPILEDTEPTTSDTASTEDAGDGDADADADAPEDDRPAASNREARYRVQLRETEAERDALAERLTAMQRGQAEDLARPLIAQPAALWVAGIELADLLDEHGQVDPAKVAAAATAATGELGLAPGEAITGRAGPLPGGGNYQPATADQGFASAFARRP